MKVSSLNLKNIIRPEPEKNTREEFIRLDRNERTTLFEEKQFKEIMSQISPYDLTPYANLESLYCNISNWLNIKREEILVTHGSEQAIKMIFETFVSRGTKVLNFNPNFAMYAVYSEIFNADVTELYYNENLEIDAKELTEKVQSGLDLIFISNPGHNGKLLSKNQILSIIKVAAKNSTFVVIDEAYGDFCGFSMVEFIKEYDNFAIIKTLSKAFGLASLRVGFIISNSKIIDELYKIKPVHEISGISSKIASYFIENISLRDDYIKEVEKSKIFLYKEFKKLQIKFFTSDSNFIYFSLGESYDVKIVLDYFKSKGILIKNGANIKPYLKLLRITVGEINQMMTFIKILKDLIYNEKKDYN